MDRRSDQSLSTTPHNKVSIYRRDAETQRFSQVSPPRLCASAVYLDTFFCGALLSLCLALAALVLTGGGGTIEAAERLVPLASLQGGGGNGELSYPVSLFYDAPTRRLYVVDAGANFLLSFDERLKYLARFDHQGQLQTPLSLAKDGTGRFYILEGEVGRILLYDPKTRLSRPLESDGMRFPRALSLSPEGELYVADRVGGKIFVLDPEGKKLRQIQLPAGGGHVADLWIDGEGKAYVVDPLERKVHVFDRQGSLLLSFGRAGEQEGEFAFPVSVCQGEGMILVADSHRHKILFFDPAGRFLFEFGKRGYEEGELNFPIQVRMGAEGKVFVINKGTRNVEVFQLKSTTQTP